MILFLKKCKPTVFIKSEDGLKRILRLEAKKPRASKRLRKAKSGV